MKWPLVLLLLAACKGKHDEATATAGYTVDATCEAAVKKAADAPLNARPQILIDGCRVCGEWTPILKWNTPQQEGGPPRIAIEQAMLACHAYCDPNAKQRFLGALDAARGTTMRTPWRELAEVCKGEVSAVPDARFMGGAYFALDRIARAIFAKGGELAQTAAKIELPLPAVSPTGVGPVLPDVDGAAPRIGNLAVTVLGDKLFVGWLPRAHLTASGVAVDLGKDGYPGTATTLDKLPDSLAARLAEHPGAMISVLAPYAMPAQQLVPVVERASAAAPTSLAANFAGAPEGWALPTAIPVGLVGSDPITVTPEMTVQQLAAAIAQHKGSSVTLRMP